MKTQPNEGAYPMPRPYGNPYDGLTKREYFAAQALTGLLPMVQIHHENAAQVIAAQAVRIADAIITQLNKEVKDESR